MIFLCKELCVGVMEDEKVLWGVFRFLRVYIFCRRVSLWFKVLCCRIRGIVIVLIRRRG